MLRTPKSTHKGGKCYYPRSKGQGVAHTRRLLIGRISHTKVIARVMAIYLSENENVNYSH